MVDHGRGVSFGAVGDLAGGGDGRRGSGPGLGGVGGQPDAHLALASVCPGIVGDQGDRLGLVGESDSAFELAHAGVGLELDLVDSAKERFIEAGAEFGFVVDDVLEDRFARLIGKFGAVDNRALADGESVLVVLDAFVGVDKARFHREIESDYISGFPLAVEGDVAFVDLEVDGFSVDC